MVDGFVHTPRVPSGLCLAACCPKPLSGVGPPALWVSVEAVCLMFRFPASLAANAWGIWPVPDFGSVASFAETERQEKPFWQWRWLPVEKGRWWQWRALSASTGLVPELGYLARHGHTFFCKGPDSKYYRVCGTHSLLLELLNSAAVVWKQP